MKNDIKGCVYLVGAGPGDPGLVTVRGMELIKKADVIVYDNLVPDRLLQQARADAELIYVGKQAGEHSLPQEKINQLLIEKAREKQIIVRLKGGDPFVFGRGAEEAIELVAAGVKFEVVPGVSSGIAVCAYAGIPVTHRDFASDLAFITGHEDPTRKGESHIDWEALGRWQGTLVFYMGVRNLPMICANLQRHGMTGDTPAAIIRCGTTAAQQTLKATVSTIAELAAGSNFAPPAIIVIGKVVDMRDQLNWFESRPLFGSRIIVTRSRAQAGELVNRLSQLGADLLEFPTIKIKPPLDSQLLRKAVHNLQRYHWIIFTSVHGVEFFFEYLHNAGHDSRGLGSAKVCAIGPATAGRLKNFGIVADLVPPQFVAESIVSSIGRAGDIKGKSILLPRADIARADLAEALKRMDAHVEVVTAYRTVAENVPKDEVLNALQQNNIDWITFTSSSTVKNFFAQIDVNLLSEKSLRIASIGPITSAAIRQAGLSVDVEAGEYTIDGLVKAICEKGGK
jgi:uroporphyrinogen III methyltransferase/synthase